MPDIEAEATMIEEQDVETDAHAKRIKVHGVPKRQIYLEADAWSPLRIAEMVLLVVSAVFDIVMLARVLRNMGLGRQISESIGIGDATIWAFILAAILLVILIVTMLKAGGDRFDNNRIPWLTLALWALGLATISAARLFMLGAETATIGNEADIFGRIFNADNSGYISELLMMDVFSVLTGALAYKIGEFRFSEHLSAYRRMNKNLYELQDEINEDVKGLEKMAAKSKKIFDSYNYFWRETKAEAYAEFRNTYLKMLDEFVLMNELDADAIEKLKRAGEDVPQKDPDVNDSKPTLDVIGNALIPNLHIPNANIRLDTPDNWSGNGTGTLGGSGADGGFSSGFNLGHPLVDTPPIEKDYQPFSPQLPEGYELQRVGPGEGKPIEEIMMEAAEIASGKRQSDDSRQDAAE